MRTGIYESLCSRGRKKLALLVDPDKFSSPHVISEAGEAGADYVLIGGSLISYGSFHSCVKAVKENSKLPVLLFPGGADQIDPSADAVLFLSLISGRNADNLIGKHVIAAPLIKKTSLEVIPTGYMLIDGGNITAAAYMSNTLPIPHDKEDIASCTAMAGEMLGLKLIYMDAGSGAMRHVSASMIREVKKNISVPLVVGGGIRTPDEAYRVCASGADMIVIGTAAEESPSILKQMAEAVHAASKTTVKSSPRL